MIDRYQGEIQENNGPTIKQNKVWHDFLDHENKEYILL